jgi:ribonuclease PH
MLPGATHTRNDREAARGKQGGRTLEIQRLIGRSLRAAVDLQALGERTVRIDCDVIQADGGTRTASITGAAWRWRTRWPGRGFSRRSGSLWHLYRWASGTGVPVLDLDYAEDSGADTDMNVVRLASGGFIEIQGTAEAAPFDEAELAAMLAWPGRVPKSHRGPAGRAGRWLRWTARAATRVRHDGEQADRRHSGAAGGRRGAALR